MISFVLAEPDEIEIKIEIPDAHHKVEKSNYPTYENAQRRQNEEQMQLSPCNLWTSKATSCLINQYRKYRSMVGQATQFRSLRDMFETISVEMIKQGYYFSAQKCENKWRVLERKYKNLVIREMQKKPGRIKHYGHWEHKRALDEIFHEKRKSVYLKECDFPPASQNSTKYALILPKSTTESNNDQVVNETMEKLKKSIEKLSNANVTETSIDSLVTQSTMQPTQSEAALPKESTNINFEKFLAEIKKLFDDSERNKQRRHLELMAVRRSELQVQQKLLKIKEQKLEFEKRKILALAQSVQLNI